jgi:hypothetical protein
MIARLTVYEPVALLPTTCTPPIKWPSTIANFTSSSYTNAMEGYPDSLRRYWMTEEEDDDTHFLVDDDEAEAATYNHLV